MSQDNKTNEKKTNKKGGFFSKITDLMYTEDSSENTSEQVDTKSTENKSNDASAHKFNYSEVSTTPNIPGVMIPNSQGVFDQKFYDNFLQIIEANNMPGIDYCEFSKSKKANDAITGMAEPMKFQAAFQALKANNPNLTKERLLETADFYIGKLNEEEQNFQHEMQSEVEAQVVYRQNQATQKQNEISQKQEQIAKLQSEIATLNNDIATLNSEAQQAQLKIDATAKNFKVSLEVLKGQIAMDKQSIQNFIQ